MKNLAMFLVVMLVAVSGAAAYLWREATAQRARNAHTVERISAAEIAWYSASGAAPAVQVSHSVGTVPAFAPDVPAQHQKSAGTGINPLMEAMRQYKNSPEGREHSLTRVRLQLADKYADLAKEMNLSPDKAGKMLDLLAKRQEEESADFVTGGSKGPQDRAAREERRRVLEEKERAYESELSALLGSSYPKWGEYESRAAERQRDMYTQMGKNQLRDTITAGGTPLSDAQFRSLTTALDAEQGRIDRETTSIQQQMQRLPESNRRLAEVAAAHLNPQQLERYRQYLQQQEAMLSMMGAFGITDEDEDP